MRIEILILVLIALLAAIAVVARYLITADRAVRSEPPKRSAATPSDRPPPPRLPGATLGSQESPPSGSVVSAFADAPVWAADGAYVGLDVAPRPLDAEPPGRPPIDTASAGRPPIHAASAESTESSGVFRAGATSALSLSAGETAPRGWPDDPPERVGRSLFDMDGSEVPRGAAVGPIPGLEPSQPPREADVPVIETACVAGKPDDGTPTSVGGRATGETGPQPSPPDEPLTRGRETFEEPNAADRAEERESPDAKSVLPPAGPVPPGPAPVSVGFTGGHDSKVMHVSGLRQELARDMPTTWMVVTPLDPIGGWPAGPPAQTDPGNRDRPAVPTASAPTLSGATDPLGEDPVTVDPVTSGAVTVDAVTSDPVTVEVATPRSVTRGPGTVGPVTGAPNPFAEPATIRDPADDTAEDTTEHPGTDTAAGMGPDAWTGTDADRYPDARSDPDASSGTDAGSGTGGAAAGTHGPQGDEPAGDRVLDAEPRMPERLLEDLLGHEDGV